MKFVLNILLGVQYKDRKWYHIIGWWEVRRIPYNIFMMVIGYLSFYIAYISIPLIYLLIGLGLNMLYTGGWLFEITVSGKINDIVLKNNLPKQLYLLYLVMSTVIVYGFAIGILI